MECGPQDALCQLTSWLSQNDLLAPWLVEVIGRFGIHANGLAGHLAQLVRDYGQTIVGLVGVTFGFWRWWRYREHILHRRLAEYLRESDARLVGGTADLIEMIQRPAPGQQFKDPLFANDDLRVVLRERNWDKPAYALGVAESSDFQLGEAIDAINRRRATAQAMVASLNAQLFSALSIRGAIAASQRRGNDNKAFSDALGHFKAALDVPGYGRDLPIRELEAHQMRKLGLGGRTVYDEPLRLATTLEDARTRNLHLARLKRYAAEMAVRITPRNAYWLLTDPGEALELLAKCEPLSPGSGWRKETHNISQPTAQRSPSTPDVKPFTFRMRGPPIRSWFASCRRGAGYDRANSGNYEPKPGAASPASRRQSKETTTPAGCRRIKAAEAARRRRRHRRSPPAH
jgi:hypothetical protein